MTEMSRVRVRTRASRTNKRPRTCRSTDGAAVVQECEKALEDRVGLQGRFVAHGQRVLA